MSKLEEHEQAYQTAKDEALDLYQDWSLSELKAEQQIWLKQYPKGLPTHKIVGKLEVLHELIGEAEKHPLGA